VGGNGDVHGDVSGEEAAWRDLIARFDLPLDTATAKAPWPAREDLAETADEPAADRGTPEALETRETTDTAVGRDQAGPGPASLRRAGLPGPDTDISRGPAAPDSTAPDSTALDSTAADGAAADRAAPDRAAPDRAAPDRAAPDTAAADRAAADSQEEGQPRTGAGGWDVAGGGSPRGRGRIIRRAGPVPPPSPAADEQDEDDEDGYVPPPPEPLPPLDPLAKGAWAGLLGGPGYLLVATLIGWQVSDWAALLAIAAFIGGFATLVLRMGDKPRDDDDNGAVV
jgi:hypothetical protein